MNNGENLGKPYGWVPFSLSKKDVFGRTKGISIESVTDFTSLDKIFLYLFFKTLKKKTYTRLFFFFLFFFFFWYAMK